MAVRDVMAESPYRVRRRRDRDAPEAVRPSSVELREARPRGRSRASPSGRADPNRRTSPACAIRLANGVCASGSRLPSGAPTPRAALWANFSATTSRNDVRRPGETLKTRRWTTKRTGFAGLRLQDIHAEGPLEQLGPW